MNTLIRQPSLWLIALIVGLPQLSETVYTPSLPDIAHALSVSDNMVEYTLTIYLFGFAVGILFWGNLSDKIGRRPTLLMGLAIYILGCIGCWYSMNINMLLFFRFIQALGGSAGSVLGQAIARDTFLEPKERGKAFSTISMALACAPALGPIIGGFTDQYFGWTAVFLVLIAIGACVCLQVFLTLPETNTNLRTTKDSNLFNNFIKVLTDKHVLSMGVFVGTCNGLVFSLYSEGPFYMIEMLGLTPSQYGCMYLVIAAAIIAGGMYSRHLNAKHQPWQKIILKGILITIAGTGCLTLLAYAGFISKDYGMISIALTISFLVVMSFGITAIIPNSLSNALENYKDMAGTAASFFGFYYYVLASGMTFVMGFIHDGTFVPMPLYFLSLSCAMLFVYGIGVRRRN
jgi:DHA1 family bicyclomycin/chloramphenicol resistance-like MFS transporter